MVKLRLRDNESVNEAVRRFRKLVEHAGVKKEMRKREFYEKPSDIRRRDRRRAEMRAPCEPANRTGNAISRPADAIYRAERASVSASHRNVAESLATSAEGKTFLPLALREK